MRCAALISACLLAAACDTRPELVLCQEVDRCDHAGLLVEPDVCAEQVQVALGMEGPDCQRCVTGLRCEAIEGVLAGKKLLRSLCTTCTEHLEIPVPEGTPPMLVSPAIVYRPPEVAAVAPHSDELSAQADAVCAQGEECEGVELLLKREECAVQVAGAFATRDAECRRCTSSLSCAGSLAVVRGEQKLSSLCPRCGDALNARGHLTTPGPGGPYLVIAGLVAAKLPPAEEAEPAAITEIKGAPPPPPAKPAEAAVRGEPADQAPITSPAAGRSAVATGHPGST